MTIIAHNHLRTLNNFTKTIHHLTTNLKPFPNTFKTFSYTFKIFLSIYLTSQKLFDFLTIPFIQAFCNSFKISYTTYKIFPKIFIIFLGKSKTIKKALEPFTKPSYSCFFNFWNQQKNIQKLYQGLQNQHLFKPFFKNVLQTIQKFLWS